MLRINQPVPLSRPSLFGFRSSALFSVLIRLFVASPLAGETPRVCAASARALRAAAAPHSLRAAGVGKSGPESSGQRPRPLSRHIRRMLRSRKPRTRTRLSMHASIVWLCARRSGRVAPIKRCRAAARVVVNALASKDRPLGLHWQPPALGLPQACPCDAHRSPPIDKRTT